MAKETAIQKAERELKALETAGAKPAANSGKKGARGKPAVSNAEIEQRKIEERKKALEKQKAAERQRMLNEQKAREAARNRTPPTPREQGAAAAQKLKQTLAVKAPTAPPPVQKTLGFLSEFKPTRKGIGKALFAAGTAALAYGGYKILGADTTTAAPAKPAKPAKPATGTGTQKAPAQAAPTVAPQATPAAPVYSPEASQSIGMTTKDLEKLFKKTQPKNRYTV